MNAELRRQILTAQIAGAVLASGCAVVTYRSEWNGLDAVMPMDHWLECDGHRIDLAQLGWAWSEDDLGQLEKSGALLRLRQWTNPDDTFESACWYLANAVARDPRGQAVALLQAARALLGDPATALAGSRWRSPSEWDAEIVRTIDALRGGSDVTLATWADPGGDFVRVGTASGWATPARTIAEQMRGAAAAIGATKAPQSVASVRRDQWAVRLLFAVIVLHLVLFAALIGLPPNPLNSIVKDAYLARGSPHGGFGIIETSPIFWLSFVGVLLLFFAELVVALLVWAALRRVRGEQTANAASTAREPQDAGADVGPGFAATDVGARRWGHYERRVALALAIATPIVAAVMYVADSVDRAAAGAVATVATFSPQRAPLATLPRHVTLRVIERRDLVSAVHEHTAYHGRMVDTSTTFSGVRTDFKTPLPDDEMIIPLAPIDATDGRVLELFWHATRNSDPSLYPRFGGGATPNAEVSHAGTLHRRALPLFVVNSYRRAGLAVADDYFVLEPEVSDFDRSARRVAVLVIGWSAATLLFVAVFLSDPKRRRRRGLRARSGSSGGVP